MKKLVLVVCIVSKAMGIDELDGAKVLGQTALDQALLIAAMQGDAVEVNNAINRGADVNVLIPSTLQRPLGVAVSTFASELYRYEPDTQSYRDTVSRYEATIKALLERGATILAEDFVALAQKGYMPLLEEFEKKKPVRGVTDPKTGYTPLYSALEYGETPAALFLITKGSDVTKAPYTGRNADIPPLQLAIELYYEGVFQPPREITLQVIEELLKNGARITPVIMQTAEGKSKRLKEFTQEFPNALKRNDLMLLLQRYQ